MRPGAKRPGPRGAGEGGLGSTAMLVLLAVVAFAATYSVMSAFNAASSALPDPGSAAEGGGVSLQAETGEKEGASHEGEGAVATATSSSSMCRGLEHLELWGEVDKWGSSNLLDSPEACCQMCQERCQSVDSCSCNSWVYCGDKEACQGTYRQCWLKKQEDVLKPDVHSMSPDVPWTSGFVHAPGQGIIALVTELGNIRIRLEPTWAPHTVHYVQELLQMKYCTGCQLYRAEGLGEGWNADGSRTSKPPGPPYALVQGALQTDGLPFKPIAREASPIVKRGFVCLVGEGPDFFISLAEHTEWGHAHTVFGRVPEEDLADVVQKILERETKQETWGETKVLALANSIEFKIERDTTAIIF